MERLDDHELHEGGQVFAKSEEADNFTFIAPKRARSPTDEQEEDIDQRPIDPAHRSAESLEQAGEGATSGRSEPAARDSGDSSSRPHKQTRKRNALNCTPCRKRKRKCDRQLPCASCIKRGESDQCNYTSIDAQTTAQARHLQLLDSNADLRERIERLEALVRSYSEAARLSDERSQRTRRLGEERSGVLDAEESPTEQSKSLSSGTLAGAKDKATGDARYKGLASWDMVLREIDDIKIAVDETFDTAYPEESAIGDADLTLGPMFGSSTGTSGLDQGLSRLPDHRRRAELLLKYFESYHPYYPYIDPQDFYPEYRRFCASPQDPLMVAQILSMMALAVANDEQSSSLADFYANESMKCLRSTGMTNNFNLVSLSTLLNNLFFYQRERFMLSSTWVMLGVVVQIARALGLHRDPTQFGIFGNLAQKRRALWIAVMTMDTIHAARYGRATIVAPDEWDSASPILGMLSGSIEVIPMHLLFTHAKQRAVVNVQQVHHRLFKPLSRPTYKNVLEMEQEVRRTVSELPRFTTQQETTPMRWLYNRFSVFIEAHTILLMHRPFLLEKGVEYCHSRAVCVDAARRMITVLSEMEARNDISQFDWHIREFASIACLPGATTLCLGLWIKANPEYAMMPVHLVEGHDDEADKDMIQRTIQRLQDKNQLKGGDLIERLFNHVVNNEEEGSQSGDPSVAFDVVSQFGDWGYNYGTNRQNSMAGHGADADAEETVPPQWHPEAFVAPPDAQIAVPGGMTWAGFPPSSSGVNQNEMDFTQQLPLQEARATPFAPVEEAWRQRQNWMLAEQQLRAEASGGDFDTAASHFSAPMRVPPNVRPAVAAAGYYPAGFPNPGVNPGMPPAEQQSPALPPNGAQLPPYATDPYAPYY